MPRISPLIVEKLVNSSLLPALFASIGKIQGYFSNTPVYVEVSKNETE